MSTANTAHTLDQSGDQAISDALALVLGSKLFADVPRLSRFLSFVVDETLAGRGNRLKGFVIACEVFDKTDPSDAQTTTIVRVEAGRLRRRLADYYAGEGHSDPVRISIPKGAYRPLFEENTTVVANEALAPNQESRAATASVWGDREANRARRSIFSVVATLTLLLVTGAAGYYLLPENDSGVQSKTPVIGAHTQPVIAVLPLENFDDMRPNAGMGLEITESLIAALSKRPDLHVMALSSSDYFRSEVTSVKDIAREMGVSHVIKGGFSSERNRIHITIALHDALSGYAIWSDDFYQDTSRGASSIISRIIIGVSSQLGLAQSTPTHSSIGFDADRYALHAQAINLTHPPGNKLRVNLALGIFDTLIEEYPDFANAHAGAAYAHSARVWWRHSELPEEDTREAQFHATKALELDPNAGLAYLAQGLLSMHGGDQDGAVAYLQKSVDVQPSNALALSVLAMFKIWAGQPEGTLPLAEQAIRLDPFNTRAPYWNILGIVQFHLGNYEKAVEAIQKNLRQGGPRPAAQPYYLAASLVGLGQEEAAADLLAGIDDSIDPAPWQVWVYRNFKDKAEFDYLMSQLEPLGVEKSVALENE